MALVQNIDVQGATIDSSRSLDALTVTQNLNMGQLSTLHTRNNGGYTIKEWANILANLPPLPDPSEAGTFGGTNIYGLLTLDGGYNTLFDASGCCVQIADLAVMPGMAMNMKGISVDTDYFGNVLPADAFSFTLKQYNGAIARPPTAIHGALRNPVGAGFRMGKLTQMTSSTHNRIVNRELRPGVGTFTQFILDSQTGEFGFSAMSNPSGIITLEVIQSGDTYNPAAATYALISVNSKGQGAVLANAGLTFNGTNGITSATLTGAAGGGGSAGFNYSVGDVLRVAGGATACLLKVTRVFGVFEPKPGSIRYDDPNTMDGKNGQYRDTSVAGVAGAFSSNSRNAFTTQNVTLGNQGEGIAGSPSLGRPLLLSARNYPIINLKNSSLPGGAASSTPYGSVERTRLAFPNVNGVNSGSINVQVSTGNKQRKELESDFVNSGNMGINA